MLYFVQAVLSGKISQKYRKPYKVGQFGYAIRM